MNDNDILVGQSFGSGFAFDLSPGRTLNLNDFLRAGFKVDSVVSLADINEINEFIGFASLGKSTFGYVGRVSATSVPELSPLLLLGNVCVLSQSSRVKTLTKKRFHKPNRFLKDLNA